MELDRSASIAELAHKFAAAWHQPDPARFSTLLHEHCLLLQPATKPVRGRDAARREFERLVKWLPDIKGHIDLTLSEGNVLCVIWRLTFTLGRKPFELRIVDRIVMEDGLIKEREAYYDSLRFMTALLRRPSSWPGYWRYRGYFGK